MDKLKPLGIKRGPGEVVVLIWHVELVACCISQIPMTEQIWDGVSNSLGYDRLTLQNYAEQIGKQFPRFPH